MCERMYHEEFTRIETDLKSVKKKKFEIGKGKCQRVNQCCVLIPVESNNRCCQIATTDDTREEARR